MKNILSKSPNQEIFLYNFTKTFKIQIIITCNYLENISNDHFFFKIIEKNPSKCSFGKILK